MRRSIDLKLCSTIRSSECLDSNALAVQRMIKEEVERQCLNLGDLNRFGDLSGSKLCQSYKAPKRGSNREKKLIYHGSCGLSVVPTQRPIATYIGR